MSVRERNASEISGFSIDWPPTAASTRERAGSISTACLRSSKNVHLSWSPGVHSGRSSRPMGIPIFFATAIALQLICTANGCVASIIASNLSDRTKSANPSAPPKPPTRVRTRYLPGLVVLPAKDASISNCGSRDNSSQRRRASAVPAKTSNFFLCEASTFKRCFAQRSRYQRAIDRLCRILER